MTTNPDTTTTLIFVYGTLKKSFPNHHIIQNLESQNHVHFLGIHQTLHPYPLVLGPYNIPYLINLPDTPHSQRVTGELYSVTIPQGLVQLDALEGIEFGHYERLPIKVVKTCGDVVEAEAYFAHREFGEALWVKKGKVGFGEYVSDMTKGYVKKDDRVTSRGVLENMRAFLFDGEN